MLVMKTAVLVFVVATTMHAAPSCGQTPVKPNITGNGDKVFVGDVALPYSWPWQVVLCTTGWADGCELECGGTIINERWVMTAAHCVNNDMNPRSYQIKAGVFHEDSTQESGEQIVGLKSIHVHPTFNMQNTDLGKHIHYDVSLLELAKPLVYTDHVQPVCLPVVDSDAIAKGRTGWLTGWGRTRDDADASIALKQANLPFVDYSECEAEFPGEICEDSMVCTGSPGRSPCYGDSGGPLVVPDSNGAWFQVGIVSWGSECGEDGTAAVFSRVAPYCSFINITTKGRVLCQTIA